MLSLLSLSLNINNHNHLDSCGVHARVSLRRGQTQTEAAAREKDLAREFWGRGLAMTNRGAVSQRPMTADHSSLPPRVLIPGPRGMNSPASFLPPVLRSSARRKKSFRKLQYYSEG